MDGFNEQFLISVFIIAIGYLLKKGGNIVKEEDGGSDCKSGV
ncbi:hypothetical protein [Gracilibacillus sp. JCM 18860]